MCYHNLGQRIFTLLTAVTSLPYASVLSIDHSSQAVGHVMHVLRARVATS